jgi:hypothetical protein
MSSKINPHIGSSLDDFLKQEGLYEDATNNAVMRVLAWQIENATQKQGITNVEKDMPQGLKPIVS